MLSIECKELLDKEAEKLMEEKKLEYPTGEVEIVYVPVVVTRKDGNVACISSNYKDIIR